MYKVILPLFTLVFLGACESSRNGGPCEYEIDTVAATIIRMDSSGNYDPFILVSVPSKDRAGGVDTVAYNSNSDPKDGISWEDANERGYSVGARLKCVREYRTSGHCTPEMFTVKKELYR